MELFEQILVIPITGYIVGMKCSNFVNFSKSSAKIKVQCTAFWNAQYIDYSHLNTTIAQWVYTVLCTQRIFYWQERTLKYSSKNMLAQCEIASQMLIESISFDMSVVSLCVCVYDFVEIFLEFCVIDVTFNAWSVYI